MRLGRFYGTRGLRSERFLAGSNTRYAYGTRVSGARGMGVPQGVRGRRRVRPDSLGPVGARRRWWGRGTPRAVRLPPRPANACPCWNRGIVGAVLTGVFAREAIGGTAGALEGNVGQVWTQVYGIFATIIWCAVATFVILLVIRIVMGLRVSEAVEVEGLDYGQHGEVVQ